MARKKRKTPNTTPAPEAEVPEVATLEFELKEGATPEEAPEESEPQVESEETPEEEEEEVPEEEPEASPILPGEAVPEDDDEFVVTALRDSTIKDEDAYGLFKQQDGVVGWSIQGLFDDAGEVKSKRALQANPPTLRIEDSKGSFIDFVLTKDFTVSLTEALSVSRDALYGVKHKKKRNVAVSFWEALKGAAKEKPLNAVLVGVLAVFCVLVLIL